MVVTRGNVYQVGNRLSQFNCILIECTCQNPTTPFLLCRERLLMEDAELLYSLTVSR